MTIPEKQLSGKGAILHGYAIELYFDADTESAIREFRKKLYDDGIKPVLGLMNDRPHLSLAVFGRTDPAPLRELCESFSHQTAGFEIKLGSIGVFPTTENVLFLSPVPSFHLLTAHRSFHKELLLAGIQCSKYYLPGNWVPHCTIEFELSDAQHRRALALSKSLFIPLTGQLIQVGLVGFRPVEYLVTRPLQLKD